MRDVIERALVRIGVCAVDEPVQPDDAAKARATLEGLYEELKTPWGIGDFTWTLDAIPMKVRMPLAHLLAIRLAPDYGMAAPEPEKTALVRLRAVCAVWPAVPADAAERQRQRDEEDLGRWF